MIRFDNYLTTALRRVRLMAAVALSENDRLAPDDQARLSQRANDALREERALREAAGADCPLARLSARLALRPVDETLLLAAIALETDPLFAITVSALAGEEPRNGITAKLMAQLLRFAGDETLELGLDGSHPLVDAGLLESGAAPGLPESLKPYRVAGRAISFLAGMNDLDPQLRRCAEIVLVPEGADLEYARPAIDLITRALISDEDAILCIEGPDGVGRRTAVAAAMAALGRPVVAIDAARLSQDRVRFMSELRALRRECWLRGGVPVVARLDTLGRRDRPAERNADIAEALESRGAVRGPVVLTMTGGTELPDFQRRLVRVRLDGPETSARARIWLRALAPSLAEGVADELPSVVQPYALMPGGIGRAAANARLIAASRGASTLTVTDIRDGVSAEIQERFSGLAQRVTVTQRWDDLVLPQDTLDDVKAFTSRAGNASVVYDRWGFRDKLGKGLGLSALFSGPPGTGKTMVAGLIAATLGLELYQVDLSQVVSKWVGETEKQLGKIFDAAAMGQAMLLFDEADALFAKRTEVKSSNDRYANLEVNYLLQRIEAYAGVAILTTNLEASVDPAFKRRLAAEVKFYPPEKEEREKLWRALIPSRAPIEGDLDFDDLADRYKEMCGGHIRNAVLRAAFLAAAETTSITQGHLHRAARSEYRAMGKVL